MPKKKTPTPTPTETTAQTADAPALPPAAQIVLALLQAEIGTTAAELSERSGLARSTVTKSLGTLLDQGLTTRQEGGHEGARRIADSWFAALGATPPAVAAEDDHSESDSDADMPHTESATATVDPSDDETGLNGAAPAIEEDADGLSDAARPGDDEPSGEPPAAEASPAAEHSDADIADAETVELAPDSETVGGEPTTRRAEPMEADITDAAAADPESTSASTAEEQSPDDADVAEESEPASVVPDEPAVPRLGKGELRTMVEAHLRDNPDQAWTPTAISKVLKRSAGAINNAGMKLAETGSVTTLPDPTRFQWTASDAT